MPRKGKKHHKRRSRRVGAFKMGGKDAGLKLIAVGAGFLLGNTINTMVDKVALPKDPNAPADKVKTAKNIAMAAEVGLGGLLLLRRSTGTMGMGMKVAGGVILGAGLKRALSVLGIMTGYQNVPVIGRHRMAGFQSVPVIGRTPPQLAGKVPPQLGGYRPAGSGVGAYINQGSGVMGAIGCCEGGSGITN